MSIFKTLSFLPQSLQLPTQNWIKKIEEKNEWELEPQLPKNLVENLVRTLATSEYVADQLLRNASLHIEHGFSQTWYSKPFAKLDYESLLAEFLQYFNSDDSETGLLQALRYFRQVMMVRLIIRDQSRQAELEETTAELTELAEVTLDASLAFYRQFFLAEFGIPCDGHGDELQLVVLGMGKLGAYELNLSSDIDLIFTYEEEGFTQQGEKSIANAQYFQKLGQKVINSLSKVTGDGFVFRVDMRLRPYGQSGPLVLNFAAAETYYEKQGRDWERYALVKARVVAGDREAGGQLLDILAPFIYRRYIDFGAIEALREMKALINREVKRKGIENNIKTGPGGIREIEFIAQAFQLIRGGQETRLRERRLLVVYELLEELQLLPNSAVDELTKAYRFLRDLEHAIQALQDKQTQLLPVDEIAQVRVAFAMGFDDWESLLAKLQYYRHLVRNHFEEVVRDPKQDEEDELSIQTDDVWLKVWLSEASYEELGIEIPMQVDAWQAFLPVLCDFRDSPAVVRLQEIARERLDRLLPKLLQCVHGHFNTRVDSALQNPSVEQNAGEQLAERLIPVLEAILRRSSYMALLLENPDALDHMVRLCSASPWVASLLADHPILLDELTDSVSLYSPPGVDALRDELRQHLIRIPSDDLEWQMEHLRHFKNVHLLKVAAAEIHGSLHLMKVSDYLTFLAEVLLEAVFQLVWEQMVEKHGRPLRENGSPCDPDFIIVAYGKMGGIELGYGSDLDLVFIHDGAANLSTDGEKSIGNANFFVRLGQRIIHFLTAQTPSGRLYEVDMRLRPSGASGLLVSSLSAFEKYQHKSAWTWEHQALVRARVVAGCESLTRRFNDIRAQVLRVPREESTLLSEVVQMRGKMQSHLSKSKNDQEFDLKQDPGGMVDIEFMVQHAVLNWSHLYGSLTQYTDNIRIIDVLEETRLWSEEDCQQMKNAYLSYRSINHRLALQNEPGVTESSSELNGYRAEVTEQWLLRMTLDQ